jgi:hypothetical protein
MHRPRLPSTPRCVAQSKGQPPATASRTHQPLPAAKAYMAPNNPTCARATFGGSRVGGRRQCFLTHRGLQCTGIRTGRCAPCRLSASNTSASAGLGPAEQTAARPFTGGPGRSARRWSTRGQPGGSTGS